MFKINFTSFYFFNVAIRKYIIAYMVCIVFLLDSTVIWGNVSLDTKVFRCSDTILAYECMVKGTGWNLVM